METIQFDCPECGAEIKAPVTVAGKTGKCPKCDARVEVPEAVAGAAGAAPEAEEAVSAPVRRPRTGSGVRRRRTAAPDPAAGENTGLAIGVAAGGAVAGALIWAAISYFTNYEVGWIAWGVGGLVGGAAVLAGGRSQTVAIAAAVLAVLGIAAGKVLGFQFAVSAAAPELRQRLIDEGAEAGYDELKWDASGLAALEDSSDDEQLVAYLEEHGYEGVTPVMFRTEVEPQLRQFHAEQPTFDVWLDGIIEQSVDEVSAVDLAMSELNAIDLLFLFLGVSTAYGLVVKAAQEQSRAARAAARAAARETE